MTDVFVCYSRRDLDFVRRLAESLRERGRDMFVDLGQWWHDDGDPRHGVSADREQATRSSDATGTHSEVSADVGMIDDRLPTDVDTGSSRDLIAMLVLVAPLACGLSSRTNWMSGRSASRTRLVAQLPFVARQTRPCAQPASARSSSVGWARSAVGVRPVIMSVGVKGKAALTVRMYSAAR